jgi:hypothetical protein
MMNKKEENAQILDPMRFKVAKNMSVIPGGPQNNNPMNVTDNASPPITAPSIYGDYNQNYMQMGAGVLNPMNVGASGLPQNFPRGTGANGIPFGMQQQPDTSGVSMAPDGMESGRLAGEASKYGLNPGAMGMMGQPALPAGMPPNMPGTSGPPLMQGMPSAEFAAGPGNGMKPQNSMNPMTPGSTPTKIKKKRA